MRVFRGVEWPVYLDPSLVGIICNIIAMVIGTCFTQVTEEEKRAREKLFIVPDREKDITEMRKTLRYTKLSLLIGAGVAAVLIILWVVSYLSSLA